MTPEEETELRAKIKQAESAYHSLQTGTMAKVFVDQNGERVEYAVANRAALYNYLGELKAQLPNAPRPTFAKPMRFRFR